MIDHLARAQLAEAIRALAAGLITNDEFEARIPDSKDPAVRQVFFSGAWLLYSDNRWPYKLTGRDRLPDTARPEIARWILFLKTDRAYAWPAFGPLQSLLGFALALTTLGLSNVFIRRYVNRQGHPDVWPFIYRAHYVEALSQHPYLRGAA